MIKLIELYYDSFDLAYIIHSQEMGVRGASVMIEKVWRQDNLYLHPFYRSDLRRLYLDVHYWMDYLCDQPVIEREFLSVQEDFRSFGRELEETAYVSEYSGIELFFKLRRLQILYMDGQDYIRMKLRTLLRAFGYVRRTERLLKYLRECLMFYHMQTYLCGKEECDIGEIGLDEMITIRVI